MRLCACLVAAISACVTGCCPYGVWAVVLFVPASPANPSGFPPPAFQLGDTVPFRAEERFYEADCHDPAEPSTVDPGEYHWEAVGPNVRVVRRGQIAMVGLGPARVIASTSNAREPADFLIVPRIGGVRVTPETSVISVGDTVHFLVEALDTGGRVIPSVHRGNQLIRFHIEPLDVQDPIAANQADGDGIRFVLRGYRPGRVTITGGLNVHGADHLIASAFLDVR